MQATALVIGHSHLRALGLMGVSKLANGETRKCIVKTLHGGPPAIEGLFCFWAENTPAEILDVIVDHAAGKTLAMLWRGNFATHQFFFLRRPVFDFVLSSEPDRPLLRDAAIVPEAMVEETMGLVSVDLAQWVEKLRARLPRLERVIVAGTPPPKGDEAFVRERVELEFGAEKSRQIGDAGDYVICPAGVRYKLWALTMRVMERTARGLGLEYLPPPEAGRDENGFLRPEFYADDVTHANHRYGELFVDHLRTYLANGA